MLNKIVLSVIICLFIISYDFKIVNADINILTNIEVESDFPDGIKYKVQTVNNLNIKSIAVRYTLGQQKTSIYQYLDKDTNSDNIWKLYHRTNSREKYIPPGTIINFNFEITDITNKIYKTQDDIFIYSDSRYTWKNVSNNMITVAYHGPFKSKAELVLTSITETIDRMSILLGINISEPIIVTMYNNIPEMVIALPPSSDTVRTQLVTEGQAFPDLGVLLVLGNSSSVAGTASHEITHILNHRAADSVFRRLPSWLDEGLAEYGNINSSSTYDKALEYAINNDLIIPITLQKNLPGDADQIIIFYGQAMSIVNFMIEKHGEENLRNLLINLKSGMNMDDSLENIYGFNRIGLENNWRKSIGIPEYKPLKNSNALPTTIPLPIIKPYTFNNQSSKNNNEKINDDLNPVPINELVIKDNNTNKSDSIISENNNQITKKEIDNNVNSSCSFNMVNQNNKDYSIVILALFPFVFLLSSRNKY